VLLQNPIQFDPQSSAISKKIKKNERERGKREKCPAVLSPKQASNYKYPCLSQQVCLDFLNCYVQLKVILRVSH
jgi:hypothetical protein